MKPIVAIVIPVYNSGAFLIEAIESVEKYPNRDCLELILVNDGSVDSATLALLATLEKKGYTVLHQENKGPAAARNAGVAQTHAPYLLFLDSDNKIRNNYIDLSVAILNAHPAVGVVYGKPFLIGDVDEKRAFKPRPFDPFALLIENYIDMCAVVRREAWNAVGGMDADRKVSYEDWELWIRLWGNGWGFHFLNETTFEYRIRENSLNTQVHKEQTINYILEKNIALLRKSYAELYKNYRFYQYDKKRPIRTFCKNIYYKITGR